MEMNGMLNIKTDKEIVNVAQNILASPDEVTEYLNNNRNPPLLTPLKLYLGRVASPWDLHLANLFAEHILLNYPDLETSPEEIKDYFLQRIETLKKSLAAQLPQSEDETPEEVVDRVERRGLSIRQRKRQRARQERVGIQSINIFPAVMKSPSSVNFAWKYALQKPRLQTQAGTYCMLWQTSLGLEGTAPTRVKARGKLWSDENHGATHMLRSCSK